MPIHPGTRAAAETKSRGCRGYVGSGLTGQRAFRRPLSPALTQVQGVFLPEGAGRGPGDAEKPACWSAPLRVGFLLKQ